MRETEVFCFLSIPLLARTHASSLFDMCACVCECIYMCVHTCVCVHLAHTLGGNVCTPLHVALHARETTITVQILGVIGDSPTPVVYEA